MLLLNRVCVNYMTNRAAHFQDTWMCTCLTFDPSRSILKTLCKVGCGWKPVRFSSSYQPQRVTWQPFFLVLFILFFFQQAQVPLPFLCDTGPFPFWSLRMSHTTKYQWELEPLATDHHRTASVNHSGVGLAHVLHHCLYRGGGVEGEPHECESVN